MTDASRQSAAEPPAGHSAFKSKVIALDGPAASGKGTLARRLARAYRFAYLDTGVLYRGVAWSMMRDAADPADADAAARYARDFDIDRIDDKLVRTREVGAAASRVAAIPAVRAALLDYQRAYAARPPGGLEGAVLDGRDIGTVVCPDACVKFFVTASPETRAHRRWLELRCDRPDLGEDEVLRDLKERDARDAARADAPMKPAVDAELLDTTHLSIDAVEAAARRIIDDIFRRCV
ncbi:MAG: (d)CMP kinase [Alphaproteobacteria bacterium]|nr:(d)CMP kinase [Alphaproteobacteria bacterium]